MQLTRQIYLDNAATTPCDPRVVEAMLPYFTEKFGNAGSRNHRFGWDAEDAIELAREQAAQVIGANAKEVIFTSGSTESNNLAIKGAAEMYARAPKGQTGRGHIVTVAHEHKAVLDPVRRLMREGFDATFITPPPDGVITVDHVREALRPNTILVSVMWANNELGTINEVPQIGRLCHEREIIFHTDATQWVGKMPTAVETDCIDLLSWSGHKIYGPKGVGGLYVRRRKPRVLLESLVDGGGQERGMRSGTQNVTGIVGFGKACEIGLAEMEKDRAHLQPLRDRLERELCARLEVCQERTSDQASAEHFKHLLRLRRGREPHYGRSRYCLLERQRVHQCQPRTFVCAEESGYRRRPRSLIAPPIVWTLDNFGGCGSRHRTHRTSR